jgi:hypothetical protein
MYQVTEKSTQHSLQTPHGFGTPHRFPNASKGVISSLMSDLASQLYPTGRAFNMLKNGVMDKLHTAINRSFIRIIEDCGLTIDSTIPDNDNFSLQDCALWEYRFGIVTNENLTIAQRKDAIYRRMSRGRNVKARQGRLYIQEQLQLAGFNVFVFENGFIEGGVKVYKTPIEINGSSALNVQHGLDLQHGIGAQHGSVGSDIIANSNNPNESFSVGTNLWASFFIGGETLGEMASVDANRQIEFRELVLKLKPAHLVAFTFINFV